MNGELAEVIALVTHGTVWLSDRIEPPPSLETNTTFQYVRTVRFIERDFTATDVGTWLRHLADWGVSRIWLGTGRPRHRPFDWADERMLSAFSGGGTWFLLATGASRAQAWQATWKVGHRDAPDHRIWDVVYESSGVGDAPERSSLAGATERLRTSLTETRAFALENDLSVWADWFDRALAASGADAPEAPYHPDMMASEFPAGARRLAAAAAHSWVFGGMGSWNDLGFESKQDHGRYEALSRELYGAVLDAFVAAANVDL